METVKINRQAWVMHDHTDEFVAWHEKAEAKRLPNDGMAVTPEPAPCPAIPPPPENTAALVWAREIKELVADAAKVRGFLVGLYKLDETPPAPKAHCPRCYGVARPAYTGLFSYEPLRCERVGGCLAEREPDAVGYEIHGHEFVERDTPEATAATGRWLAVAGSPERVYFATSAVNGQCYARGDHPIREEAIALWRASAISRAKREREEVE